METRRQFEGISGTSTQAACGPLSLEQAPLLESQNQRMCAFLATAKRAASGNSTILLVGESGTGKDVLARQIHEWSFRRRGPFVVINCGTLAEQLLENELFGHVRGAFTGAVEDKPGRLEAAYGGTVFFDEIAVIAPPLQTKLLPFVQDRNFQRVGGARTVRVDARIIAASSRNLESEIASGRFREELYYRLNVITLVVPALRYRVEDIVPLAEWMLKQESIKGGRELLALSSEAAEALRDYRWPGNLRELRNVLERAVSLAPTNTITRDDLPESVLRDATDASVSPSNGIRLKELEREYIARMVAQSSTLADAAAKLGIDVTTLWRKRKRYGI